MLRISTRAVSNALKQRSALVGQSPIKMAISSPFIKTHRYSTGKNQSEEPITIYTGPLANVAKKLKLFSIASLSLGSGISPFVFAIDVPVPFVAKAALVGVGKVESLMLVLI